MSNDTTTLLEPTELDEPPFPDPEDVTSTIDEDDLIFVHTTEICYHCGGGGEVRDYTGLYSDMTLCNNCCGTGIIAI